MKEIPLTQGKVALIDDEDYEVVSRYKWYARRDGRAYYATTNIVRPDGKHTALNMHRLILGVTERLIYVDHINFDGLDNRRSNLREATPSQNVSHCGADTRNKTGFRGVYLQKKRWRAAIRKQGRSIHLGRFDTPQEAARAYDAKARELHGEFARLNFP